MYEVSLNVVSITMCFAFAYQSVCKRIAAFVKVDVHSSRKVTLDVEDPQKKFIENVLRGLLSILPGVGFFSKYLEKMAKLDWVVC